MNENTTYDSRESTDTTNSLRMCILLVAMAIVLAGALWLAYGGIAVFVDYRVNRPVLAVSPAILGIIALTIAIVTRRDRLRMQLRDTERVLPLAVIACIAIAILLISILTLGLML